MRLISWNVNGLRACLKKGFDETFIRFDADIFCLQETKMQQGQAEIDFDGYHQYWNSAVKKGYSGVCVFTKDKPISASYGMGINEHDNEGRIINLEFESFILINVYTPNSQSELARLGYRMKWDDAFRKYVLSLDKKKPVIICGDLNVAHNEIDLKNYKTNAMNAGFTVEERGKLTKLLNSGFCDTFRHLYPDLSNAYTWWSFRANARKNNVGWRIDYFLVSKRLMQCVSAASIHPDVHGSDHCPVGIELSL